MGEQEQRAAPEASAEGGPAVNDAVTLPPPAGAEPTLGPAVCQAGELARRLEHLEGLFTDRLAYDAGKEELIRRLSEELRSYREDWQRRQNRPLFLDLAMLYDTLQHLGAVWRGCGTITGDEAREKLAVVEAELLEILARQDIRPYGEHLEVLDLRLHRTVGTEPADRPEDHHRIVRVLKNGFLGGNAVLRPEEVIVRRYQAPPASGDGHEELNRNG